MKSAASEAVITYQKALECLVSSGGTDEIEWQRSRSSRSFGEEEFLREVAWVILNSGFREEVVRSKFDYISLCFFDWSSAQEIVEARDQCIASALLRFGHYGKISAIAEVAQTVEDHGFSKFRSTVLKDPIGELRKLPHIGPVTVWHLAKNLGFNVAKPDRHLVRLAGEHGYDCVHSFCQEIAECTGDEISVIDLVLWRYMANRKILTNSQKLHSST